MLYALNHDHVYFCLRRLGQKASICYLFFVREIFCYSQNFSCFAMVKRMFTLSLYKNQYISPHSAQENKSEERIFLVVFSIFLSFLSCRRKHYVDMVCFTTSWQEIFGNGRSLFSFAARWRLPIKTLSRKYCLNL